MKALNIYLQNIRYMKLTKEKNHTVTEAVEIPNELRGVPLFDIAFDKVEWDITEENIEKHREDIDTFGAVAVYAMYDNSDVKCCVFMDQALNTYTGVDEFCYMRSLNTDIIVRVKMSGHTNIFRNQQKKILR